MTGYCSDCGYQACECDRLGVPITLAERREAKIRELNERGDAAVNRVCELLEDVSKKQAEIDRLQKVVDDNDWKIKSWLEYISIDYQILKEAHETATSTCNRCIESTLGSA